MPSALKSRRNPDIDTEAYQDFRGRGPKETLEWREAQLKSAADMWAIGDLTGLWLVPVKGAGYVDGKWGKGTLNWKPADGMKLAADRHEGDRQLYIVGPKATIAEEDLWNLSEFLLTDYDAEHEFMCFGPLYGISYDSEKRMDQFKPVDYGHQFGEENGLVPSLWYHRPSQSLLIVGGDYRIEGKDPALGNSPGIAN